MERHNMKRTLTTLLVLTATAGSAFAHPGDHAFSLVGSLAHLLTEPDHLAMMGVVALAAFGVWRWRKTKA
jgi:hydrogenase/urease accessory protein HupE